MEQNTATEGLLDRIAHTLNCPYLSDLKNPSLTASICTTVSHISAESYSLHEWKDAVEYITLSAQSFNSSEEARDYIIHFKANV